jgi:hypothetical protein
MKEIKKAVDAILWSRRGRTECSYLNEDKCTFKEKGVDYHTWSCAYKEDEECMHARKLGAKEAKEYKEMLKKLKDLYSSEKSYALEFNELLQIKR